MDILTEYKEMSDRGMVRIRPNAGACGCWLGHFASEKKEAAASFLYGE